jgi:hypothetical protein
MLSGNAGHGHPQVRGTDRTFQPVMRRANRSGKMTFPDRA